MHSSKFIVSMVAGFVFLLSATSVFAIMDEIEPREMMPQETVTERQQERLEQRAASMEARQEDREMVREQVQAVQAERRSDFAAKHAERLERRFNLYATRMLQIATRMETRAQLMNQEQKDVTDALLTIAQARAAIEQAQSDGEQAIALFRSIDPAQYETQREIALQARDLAESARVNFTSARKLLQDALTQLAQTAQE